MGAYTLSYETSKLFTTERTFVRYFARLISFRNYFLFQFNNQLAYVRQLLHICGQDGKTIYRSICSTWFFSYKFVLNLLSHFFSARYFTENQVTLKVWSFCLLHPSVWRDNMSNIRAADVCSLHVTKGNPISELWWRFHTFGRKKCVFVSCSPHKNTLRTNYCKIIRKI